MRIFLVSVVTCFIDSTRVNALHAAMCHGVAEREGAVSGEERTCTLADSYRSPLLLTRNAYAMPELFMPSLNFVVSRSLRDRLATLPNIGFEQVKFKKVVWVPYTAGDFAWQTGTYGGDDAQVFRRLKDRPDLRATIGDYFELLNWRLSAVVPQFGLLKDVHVDLGTSGSFESVDLKVSAELIQAYPILSALGAHVLSEQAFGILDPWLDRDYFSVASATI